MGVELTRPPNSPPPPCHSLLLRLWKLGYLVGFSLVSVWTSACGCWIIALWTESSATLTRPPLEEQGAGTRPTVASTTVLLVRRISLYNKLPDKRSFAETFLSVDSDHPRACGPDEQSDTHKAAAARRGCLTARHWQDIRRAVRLARSEGVELTMHGVTVGPAARGKENLSQPQTKSTTTSVRGGRGQQLTEAVGKACEKSLEKQRGQQQPPKKQRDEQRSLGRLYEFQRALACGARWLPLAQQLLRRERAISRARVWTERMEQKLALRDKLRAFVERALRHASSHTSSAELVDRDRSSSTSRSGAFARL